VIPPYDIPDVYVLDLERIEGRLVLLRDDHHLLRRFGQVEHINLEEGQETNFVLRAVADEIWSVIGGEVTLTLVDKRDDSPSENKFVNISLSASRSQSVLIPFGVAYSFEVGGKKAQMIRLTTHTDGTHPGDQMFPASEFDSILLSQ